MTGSGPGDLVPLSPVNLPFLLKIARAAAWDAAAAIMEVYADPAFAVRHKSDASPLTLADERAEQVILSALEKAEPRIPAISEERASAEGLPDEAPPRFWLVDPLDGTREFVKRNGEFTVNIALIEKDRPILGVLLAPALDILYAGLGLGTAVMQRGRGGALEPIATRLPSAEGIVVAQSRSHGDKELDAFLAPFKIKERRDAGSALKFGLVATGEADLYPRFGPTMEWDTAAGQAVLEAAGGSVLNHDGSPFRYGKKGFKNPGFIACGSDDLGLSVRERPS